MCGIAGVVLADPTRAVDPSLLERMALALRHRGPDDRGQWSGPGVGLAHTRLAVIDLSADGHQPLPNEDGTVWVVFNGEIYNFAELRADLEQRGHRFRSRTDTEVIVHLYEELGPSCVERLDGMFAFAVWDARHRSLLLARDRLGKKPLKYAEIPGGFVFASELKAILASGLVQPEVEPRDIGRFLDLGFVPAPGTGLRGIRKLPAAHRLVLRDGRMHSERYWTPDFASKRALAPGSWAAEVRDAVRRAVAKRLVSDVPLGAFLSGGIDSSVVVACMSRESSRPVETFSAGFDFDAYSELPYARAVAERHRTAHHEFQVEAHAAELLPVLARLYEEPFADCSALPSYLLARQARQHVTVVLTGDGGDEAFAGYPRYRRLAEWDRRLALAGRLGVGRLASASAALLGGLSAPLADKLDAVCHLADPRLGVRYGWMMRLFSGREQARLGRNGATAAAPAVADELVALMSDPHAGDSPIDRMCFADTMLYLPDDLLVKVDLACMAHGLEARSPLLDPEVLAVAAAAPPDVKLRGGSLKALLTEAFRDDLPPQVRERRKMGFVVPLDEWFRGPLQSMVRDLLLSADTRIRGYFDGSRLQQKVDRHARGQARLGRQLWALLMLELWHREVVETVPSAAAA